MEALELVASRIRWHLAMSEPEHGPGKTLRNVVGWKAGRSFGYPWVLYISRNIHMFPLFTGAPLPPVPLLVESFIQHPLLHSSGIPSLFFTNFPVPSGRSQC